MADILGNARLAFLRKPTTSGNPGDTGSGARARADIISVLGGNTRHLFEATSGSMVAISGSLVDPVVRSPSSVQYPGHTHAGGADGAPILRPLWSAIYGSTSASIDGWAAPSGTVSSTVETATLVDHKLRCVWIPNGPPDTVYLSARLKLQIKISAACKLTIGFRARHDNPLEFQTATLTDTGADPLTVDCGDVPLLPGSLQDGFFYVKANYTSATATVRLYSAALLHNSDAVSGWDSAP